ncbi:MAG: hypothetical protein IKK75_04795 [Clostridia bacterium]|nr:hypothetical protein [Clostridia bacterium]
MEHDSNTLMEAYFQTKDAFKRKEILFHLLCHLPDEGKDFFLNAFKKERYLDMRLAAVRGYAAYATESEVNVLMKKLLTTLQKRPASTPYNYQEYEPMRSVFLMPYLLKHYNYECFLIFHQQLEKQYHDMPDCFKNIFSLDEQGHTYQIRDPKEVSQTLDAFFEKNSPL